MTRIGPSSKGSGPIVEDDSEHEMICDDFKVVADKFNEGEFQFEIQWTSMDGKLNLRDWITPTVNFRPDGTPSKCLGLLLAVSGRSAREAREASPWVDGDGDMAGEYGWDAEMGVVAGRLAKGMRALVEVINKPDENDKTINRVRIARYRASKSIHSTGVKAAPKVVEPKPVAVGEQPSHADLDF